jgi:hypothetical protein
MLICEVERVIAGVLDRGMQRLDRSMTLGHRASGKRGDFMRILCAALAVVLGMIGPASAWTDRTFMTKGTPLRSQPDDKGKVIATIPKSQTVKGVSSSIDRDCAYETKYDVFCKVTWKGKTGYISVDDLLDLGDYEDF